MSISTFQDKIFKSGCGVAVLVGCAAAMVMSSFYSCGQEQQAVEEQAAGPIAIQIGEARIPVLQVEQQAQLSLAQQPGAAGPKMEVFALGQVLDQSVRQAATAQVAKEVGADTSDEAIRKFVTAQLDKMVTDAKQRFIDEKKLKPTASAKEFDELFKKEMGGQTPEEFRKTSFENVNKSLSDPAARESLINQIAAQLALDKLKATLNPTDAEVKASYDTYTMKRVLISVGGKPAAEAEAQAKKALAEVRAGAKFEDVMNRYSNDLPPGANKKVSETVLNLNPTDLAQNAAMAPLAKMKPGEVSEVIDVPEGKAFYKLISVKNNAPADFAKNPKKYKDQYIETRASAEMQKRIDVVAKSDAVKFPLPGYKALRDYYTSAMDFALMQKPEEFVKRIRSIADVAKAATTDQTLGDEHAALVTWYAAVDDLWSRAKADLGQAAGLREERIEALESVLRDTENFGVRMDLVDMGIETKNAELATGNLIEAAKLNNLYDTTGQTQFREINTRLAKLKAAKLITAEQAKEVQQEQERWRAEKASNDKAEKEFKAQQAADEKKNAEANKQFEAEQKKMADQVKKDLEKNKAPAPTTGASTPPPATTTG